MILYVSGGYQCETIFRSEHHLPEDTAIIEVLRIDIINLVKLVCR